MTPYHRSNNSYEFDQQFGQRFSRGQELENSYHVASNRANASRSYHHGSLVTISAAPPRRYASAAAHDHLRCYQSALQSDEPVNSHYGRGPLPSRLEMRDEARNFNVLFSDLALHGDPVSERVYRHRIRSPRDNPTPGSSRGALQATNISTGRQPRLSESSGYQCRQTSSNSERSNATSNSRETKDSSNASSSSNTRPTCTRSGNSSTNTSLTNDKTPSLVSTKVDAIHCPIWDSTKEQHRQSLPEACKREFESEEAARIHAEACHFGCAICIYDPATPREVSKRPARKNSLRLKDMWFNKPRLLADHALRKHTKILPCENYEKGCNSMFGTKTEVTSHERNCQRRTQAPQRNGPNVTPEVKEHWERINNYGRTENTYMELDKILLTSERKKHYDSMDNTNRIDPEDRRTLIDEAAYHIEQLKQISNRATSEQREEINRQIDRIPKRKWSMSGSTSESAPPSEEPEAPYPSMTQTGIRNRPKDLASENTPPPSDFLGGNLSGDDDWLRFAGLPGPK